MNKSDTHYENADCAECPTSEALHAWIDGETTADESARLEQHASTCASCSEEAAMVRVLNDIVATPESTPASLVDELLANQTLATNHMERTASTSMARYALAACALLGVGLLGYFLGSASNSVKKETRSEASTSDTQSVVTAEIQEGARGTTIETYPPAPVRSTMEQIALALTASPSSAHALLAQHRRDAAAWLHAFAKGDNAARARAAIAQLPEFGNRQSTKVIGTLLSDVSRQEAALRALTAIGSREAAEEILNERHEIDARRRYLALAAIGDDSSMSELLGRESESETIRLVVRQAIERYPDTTIPALLKVAASNDPRLATRALSHLERLRPATAVDALASLLDKEHTHVAAARVLARIDTDESLRALLRVRPSPTFDAVFSLVGPHGEALLIEQLASDSWRTRTRAIELLSRCGDVNAARALAALADVPASAPAAIAAIGHIRHPLSVEILDQLSAHARHRFDIVRALGATGLAEAVPVLLRLGRQERRLRAAAIEALAMVPMSAAVEAIVRLDGRGRLSTPTKEALQRMDDELVRATLHAMLEGPHSAHAQRAIQRLTREVLQPGTRE